MLIFPLQLLGCFGCTYFQAASSCVAGYLGEWSDDLWWRARASLVSVMAGMFRRMIRIWRMQPWSAAKVFDPRKSYADRLAEAGRFLSWDNCCYERGCCRKLKLRFPTPEALLNGQVQEFMCVLFNRVIIATTLLECDFAGIRAWLSKCKKPLSVANLCAKQFVSRIADDYDGADAADTPQTILPLWAQRYRRRNGMHVHARGACKECRPQCSDSAWAAIKDADSKFLALSPTDKDRFARQAQAFNREQKVLFDAELETAIENYCSPEMTSGEGFLGLGDLWHPLAEHRFVHHGYKPGEAFTSKRAAQWEFTGARIRASRSFDDSTPPSYCRQTYDICLEKMSRDQRSYLAFVHSALEKALVALSQTSLHGQPFFRPRFEHASCDDVWQCCSFSKARPGHPFPAELLRHAVLGVDIGADEVPFAITVAKEALHGKTVPAVRVSEDYETDLLHMLSSHGKLVALDAFDVCRSPAGLWAEVIVTGVRRYDLAAEAAAEADRKEAQKAFNVAESLTTPCKKKPRRCQPESTTKMRLTHRTARFASLDVSKAVVFSDSSEEDQREVQEDDAEWVSYANAFVKEFDGQQAEAVDVGGINIGGWTYSQGKKVGRIQHVLDGVGDVLTVRVSCLCHSGCSKVIPLAKPPSRADLVRWLQHGHAYSDSEQHLAALIEGQPFVAPDCHSLAAASVVRRGRAAPRGFVAPAGARVVFIDGREFKELWPTDKHGHKRHCGYSLKCKYHPDDDCVRDCGFGFVNPMSPQECRARLLRWEGKGVGVTVERHRELGKPQLLRNFATR